MGVTVERSKVMVVHRVYKVDVELNFESMKVVRIEVSTVVGKK